jgi:beta-glucanase (GH16 family)
MKFLKHSLVLLIAFFVMDSCKKAESNNGTIKTPPSNLAVTAIVSSDGTGKVAFTATADNAVSYAYEFGNGSTKTEASGAVNYQYTDEGTHTYTVTVTATSSSGLSIKKSIDVTVSVVRTLFWSEEFNTDGAPDPAKWGYDLGDGCPGNCGFGNNELEWYTNRPENVIVQGGLLKIKAIKENLGGKSYTSTRMLSKDKFAFTYGKVEVKAKLPAGVGTWPAIWMLGSDINTAGWPACGEIDIMEHLGRDLNKIYGTLHYPGHSGGSADGGTKLIENATTEFHIYTLDWTAAAIKIYVDGQLIHSVVNSLAIPFNHDFFLILNIAMGGGFGGPVDPGFTNATMEVDYIRIYK